MAEVLFREQPDVPVVVCSGFFDAVPLRWFAAAYVQKVDGPDVLLSAIDEVIAKKKSPGRVCGGFEGSCRQRLLCRGDAHAVLSHAVPSWVFVEQGSTTGPITNKSGYPQGLRTTPVNRLARRDLHPEIGSCSGLRTAVPYTYWVRGCATRVSRRKFTKSMCVLVTTVF